MRSWLLRVDELSALFGKMFAWLIVALTLLIYWEVFSRYALNAPHDWVFDWMYILYGILFMMAGAYTLSRNGHVRGDVLYGFFPPRVQAGLDLALYLLFFTPGVIALVYAGWDFAAKSWEVNEHSSVTASGPAIYPLKAFIPAAGALLLLQGVVEIIRCVFCLKDGTWPSRERDVEEVDVDELKKMVHAEEASGEATPGARR
jgi:TRAP-type mannitol/chloroaromatic compound transport system permease small subunit